MRGWCLIVLTACSFHSGAPSASHDDGSTTPRDASGPDTGIVHDATTAADAPLDAGSRGLDGGTSGPVVVACYAQGSPSATCTAPDHCCFSNFDSYHDGSCSTSSCAWGTISCDGPEDCSTGQFCCAHAIRDPDFGTIGYTVACQASACGAAPLNQELCHTSTTCSHGSCVGAFGNDNDLPRALQICQ